MRRFTGVLATLLALAFSPNSSMAADLSTLMQSASTAQLYSDNAEAFQMRLALLDAAQAGASVKVASFVFDYGSAVRTLSAHMCEAAKRGVQVELLVDSKSGDSVQASGAWDSSDDAKSSAELYNYMADCGVKVYIHNVNSHFVTFFGRRLPNIFGIRDGSAVSIMALLDKVTQIKARLLQVVQPVLTEQGVRSTPANILNYLIAIGKTMSDLTEAKGNNTQVLAAKIAKNYRWMITDPFWKEMDVPKMKAFVGALEQAILHDTQPGGLAELYDGLRIYNRLNHRKIFFIRNTNGDACAVIGGRNLGDHYLANTAQSFHDGDVLVCSTLPAGASEYMNGVEYSFEQLKSDTSDFIMHSPDSNKIRLVEGIHNYAYQFVKPAQISSLATPVEVMPCGQPLPNFENPRLLMSSWHPGEDAVRLTLLRAIMQEQKSIWIETAYSEFNGSLRRALEGALARGVSVHIVTNGLFISDGSSKFIRLWMEPWLERMKAKYPQLFTVASATVESKHMIHFKGAGFQCQKPFMGSVYRRYIIGSHNFHPRSGYSDKENALTWTEKTTDDCPEPTDDMRALRGQYYQNLRKASAVPLLVMYPNLQYELFFAYKMKKDQVTMIWATSVERALYHMSPDGKGKVYWYPQELQRFILLMEESGLRDMIGVLL